MRRARVVCGAAVLMLALLASACSTLPAPAQPSAPAPGAPAAPTPAPAPAPAPDPYPTRPIEIIVPANAGGGLDINARIVAKAAAERLGQPINVVNIAGGGTAIGYGKLAASKPDGYTLGIIFSSTLIHHLSLQGVTYKREDFEPIIMVSSDVLVLAVRKGTPEDLPLDKFIPYLKANNDKLSFGVGAKWGGSEFAAYALQDVLGEELNKVYFTGGAPAIAALLAGDVHMVTQYYAELKPHVEAGKLSVIGSLPRNEHPVLKDTPTFKQAGHNVVAEIWRGIAGPKGMPPHVVAKLHDAFKAALDDPAVQADLAKAQIYVSYLNTADFNQLMIEDEKTDVERVKAILAKGGN